MKRRIFLVMTAYFIFSFLITLEVEASSNNNPNEQEIFGLLENAFEAQLSLSEEFRSYQEVTDILAPYFKQEYMELFVKENLYEEKDGFIVYGSDFAMYYIPYFSYTDETKVLYEENKIYVYQFFEENSEGPVTWPDHYEVITIQPKSSTGVITNLEIMDELPEKLLMLKGEPKYTNIKNTAFFEDSGGIYDKLFHQNLTYSLESLLEMEYTNQQFYSNFAQGTM